ncbi:MAG: DnaJ domain-containing protein [Alphaproteobacteria bacterium]|nr:DnaJ domain-containing protein [Alphaproteobacteria bacterium]
MSIWSQLARLARRAFEEPEEPGLALATAGAAGPLACAPDPGDVDFTAAIVGLGAKLAKADGLVTDDEMNVFARVFRAAPRDEPAMRRVFNIARQTVLGYESYARRIARKYHDRPCLLEGVLDGLFQIAIADGVVTSEEMDYLRSVSDAFGFSDADFRRIKASHIGPDADDPYAVLGLPHTASFDEVRTAYRQLMRENHPDTATGAKSAPREFEPVAHEKAAAITTAYARIRTERGFLTRAD